MFMCWEAMIYNFFKSRNFIKQVLDSFRKVMAFKKLQIIASEKEKKNMQGSVELPFKVSLNTTAKSYKHSQIAYAQLQPKYRKLL